MAVRDVLLYPDRRLKQVCPPAQPGEVERVSGDLVETMRSFGHCSGIAAPQVAEMTRIAVVDASANPKITDSHGLLVLVNPVVVAADGAEVAREGCLSLPELTANVRRATEIRVSHSGGEVVEAHGFEARCILHEIDHLDGILFLDRVSSIVDDLFHRKRYR
ncbi:MAG: peptide deformylase [Solirubrobacterales bacterium]